MSIRSSILLMFLSFLAFSEYSYVHGEKIVVKPNLRISTPSSETSMQASKWLACQILIDDAEMQSLFTALPQFEIYLTSCVIKRDQGLISHQEFLQTYSKYIAELKNGQMPDDSTFRHLFSAVFTVTPNALYSVLVDNDQHLIRVSQPTVQLQPHKMGYSKADEKFRSKTFGSDSISWGIQFSYPQLYKDHITQEIMEVGIDPHFPNTQLFRDIQRWVRYNTIPTPIVVDSKKTNLPIRIGKNCLSWINHHPQLIQQGMRITTNES